MAIILVNTSQTGASSTATTITLSIGTVVAGNFLYIATVNNSGTTNALGTPTGNGNTYSSLFALQNTASLQVWYVFNANGGATTLSFANAVAWSTSIIVREYSGLSMTNPKDLTASATGSTAALNSGATATTTKADELVIGAFVDTWGAGQTFTVGGGYSNLVSIADSNSFDLSLEDKIVTNTDAQTATLTQTNATAWLATVATFKAPHNLGFNTNNLRPHAFSPGIAR